MGKDPMHDTALLDMDDRRAWLDRFRHLQEIHGYTASANALAFGMQRLEYDIAAYVAGKGLML